MRLNHLNQTGNLNQSLNELTLNTLRPRQNGRYFPDDIFKCIFLNENAWISIKILLKLVPKGPINKIPALVQKMAWRRSGDKPLSEPMMVSLLTHICVTRSQWASDIWMYDRYFMMQNYVKETKHLFWTIRCFIIGPSIGTVILLVGILLNHCDAIWQQGSGSTLAQIMVSCLMAPYHFLSQYWLIQINVHLGQHWIRSDPNSAVNHVTPQWFQQMIN